MKKSICRNGMVMVVAWCAIVGNAQAAVITNYFDTDPGWTGVGNTTGGANYGFSNSSNAGGSPGEIGGLFTRRSIDNFYSHVFLSGVGNEALNYDSEIEGSGKFKVTSVSGFNNGVRFGHNGTNLLNRSFMGLQIGEFNATTVRFFAVIRAGNATEISAGPLFGTVGTAYDVGYTYDPDGGAFSLGQLSLTVTGVGTLTTDVTAAQRLNPTFLNAFGISTPDLAVNQPANQANVFFDNAIYTIPEPATVGLVALAGAVLLRRRRS